MEQADVKPHISPSQVEMFYQCGEKYRRVYPGKEGLPLGVRMASGLSVHEGAEKNFKRKIKTHRDMRPWRIIEYSAETFSKIVKRGVALTADELSIGRRKVVGQEKDAVAKMAEVFIHEVAPKYQPRFVEERHRLILPGAIRDLVVRLDMATVKDEVVDLKTGRRWSQGEVDRDVTLSIYEMAYKAITRRKAKKIIIENIVKNKVEPVPNPIKTVRTVVDRQAAVHRINAMLSVLKAGGPFLPAPPKSWWCSPKYCGFWNTCPYVGNKVKREV